MEGLTHTFSSPEDISSRYQKYAILSIAVGHTMTVFPPPCLHVLLCCHHDSSLKVTDGIYSILLKWLDDNYNKTWYHWLVIEILLWEILRVVQKAGVETISVSGHRFCNWVHCFIIERSMSFELLEWVYNSTIHMSTRKHILQTDAVKHMVPHLPIVMQE